MLLLSLPFTAKATFIPTRDARRSLELHWMDVATSVYPPEELEFHVRSKNTRLAVQ